MQGGCRTVRQSAEGCSPTCRGCRPWSWYRGTSAQSLARPCTVCNVVAIAHHLCRNLGVSNGLKGEGCSIGELHSALVVDLGGEDGKGKAWKQCPEGSDGGAHAGRINGGEEGGRDRKNVPKKGVFERIDFCIALVYVCGLSRRGKRWSAMNNGKNKGI